MLNNIIKRFEEIGYKVTKVNKNGRIMHGVSVANGEIGVAYPTVYIESFLDDDSTEGEIIDAVLEALKQNSAVPFSINGITKEKIKDNVRLQILKSVDDGFIYRLWNGLYVVPYVVIADLSSEGGIASIKLNNYVLSLVDMTVDEVFEIAEENTKQDCVITGMNEIMKEMMTRSGMPEELVPITEEEKMYVMSTAKGIGGAILMTLPSIQKQIYERFGNTYVLPSSVHEVILVPDDKEVGLDSSELNELVREVNTTISLEDKLVDAVYMITSDGISVLHGGMV